MSKNRRAAMALFAVMAAFAFANVYAAPQTFLVLLIPQIIAGGAGVYFLVCDATGTNAASLRLLFWVLVLASVVLAVVVINALTQGAWMLLPPSAVALVVFVTVSVLALKKSRQQ